MDLSKSEKGPIKPVYEMLAINASVTLYAGELVIDQAGKSFVGMGSISLDWLPSPRLSFTAILKDWQPLSLGRVALRYRHSKVSFKASISSLSYRPRVNESEWPIEVFGHLPFIFGGTGTGMTRCIFHVPNFTRYLGKPIIVSDIQFYRGEAVMVGDGWHITLQQLQSADNKFNEALKSQGGYGFTHVGEITRTDGSTVKVSELKDLLENLRWWLSFCRGFWVAPLLPVGVGRDDQRWWNWEDQKIDQMQAIMTWANPYSEAFLEETYSGFMKRVGSDLWAEPVRLAIWWYLASNLRAGGMEGGLILTQAAFELLAWTLLVEERKTIGRKAFGSLTASEKLRRVLSEISIPASIPTGLSALQELATKNAWKDGPHAITQFRNGFVHPEPKKRKAVLNTGLGLFEAWSLSLWYLELMLLWLFGFKGQYQNRLRREIPRSNAVEPVPWQAA